MEKTDTDQILRDVFDKIATIERHANVDAALHRSDIAALTERIDELETWNKRLKHRIVDLEKALDRIPA